MRISWHSEDHSENEEEINTFDEDIARLISKKDHIEFDF